jgi:hypothetical protein
MPGLDTGTARGVARRFLSDFKPVAAGCRAANFHFAQSILKESERNYRVTSEAFNVSMAKRLKSNHKAQIDCIYKKAGLSKTGHFLSTSLVAVPAIHYCNIDNEVVEFFDMDYGVRVDSVDLRKAHPEITFYNMPALVSTHAWRQWLTRSGLPIEDMSKALYAAIGLMGIHLNQGNIKEVEEGKLVPVAIPAPNGAFVGYCKWIKAAGMGDVFSAKCHASGASINYSISTKPEMSVSLCIRSYLDFALLDKMQTEYVTTLGAWFDLYRQDIHRTPTAWTGLVKVDSNILNEFNKLQDHGRLLFSTEHRRRLFEMKIISQEEMSDPASMLPGKTEDKSNITSIHEMSLFMNVPIDAINNRFMMGRFSTRSRGVASISPATMPLSGCVAL